MNRRNKPLKVKAAIKYLLQFCNSLCHKANFLISKRSTKLIFMLGLVLNIGTARLGHMCVLFSSCPRAKQVSFRYREVDPQSSMRESSSRFCVPVNALFIYLIGWRVHLISIILAWWESSPVQTANARVSMVIFCEGFSLSTWMFVVYYYWGKEPAFSLKDLRQGFLFFFV